MKDDDNAAMREGRIRPSLELTSADGRYDVLPQ